LPRVGRKSLVAIAVRGCIGVNDGLVWGELKESWEIADNVVIWESRVPEKKESVATSPEIL